MDCRSLHSCPHARIARHWIELDLSEGDAEPLSGVGIGFKTTDTRERPSARPVSPGSHGAQAPVRLSGWRRPPKDAEGLWPTAWSTTARVDVDASEQDHA